MRGDILAPLVGVRPAGIPQHGLAAQLSADAERLERPKRGDALAPIRVFGVAGGPPVSRHELADTAGDHAQL